MDVRIDECETKFVTALAQLVEVRSLMGQHTVLVKSIATTNIRESAESIGFARVLHLLGDARIDAYDLFGTVDGHLQYIATETARLDRLRKRIVEHCVACDGGCGTEPTCVLC